MAKGPMGSFEIPAEMRNVAEQSVVQARQAFDGFMSAAQKALAQWEQQAATAQAGAKGASEKVMDFAERNVSNSFEFAQRLVRAKDAEEMMRLQAEFIRSQMETLSEQARELGADFAESAKGGTKGPGSR
jgi:phasin